MLPRANRLTQSADFARIRRDGQSRAHPLLVLSTAVNGGESIRVGVVAGKKVGSAVQRNRAKRLLREAIRAQIDRVAPGTDIVLIARQQIVEAEFSEVLGVVETLLRRARLVKTAAQEGRRQ